MYVCDAFSDFALYGNVGVMRQCISGANDLRILFLVKKGITNFNFLV
jgi:hypothetical protein